MVRFRVLRVSILGAALAFSTAAATEPPRVTSPEPALSAYLDGRPIPLRSVGEYYCDDFSYPIIQCSVEPAAIEARASLALLAAVDYATIYDLTAFNGAYMHVSQDYPALVFIGWNDKVSSVKARNSQSGKFWTDWFYGGSYWMFCCNSQYSSLGSWDNVISSVHRL